MGNYHAPFWIGGGGSNPFADHTLLARVREKAIHAVMRIIGASAPMLTASVACAYVGTSNYALIWWMRQCGTRVCKLLADPSRLEQEYRQRLLAKERSTELTGLEASLGRLRQGIARLIDSYAEGMIDKAEFGPRITRMRERITQLEEQVQQIRDEAGMEHELRLILGRVDTFAAKVKEGLAEAEWLTRRELIRTLVKRVEVNQEQVNVIFRIGPTTPSTPSDQHLQSLHHCGGRAFTAVVQRDAPRV